jgi:SAM-dependent methyltransferase
LSRYGRRDAIYRFLTAGREAAAGAFLRQYRIVRAHDGFRSSSPEYYRMLPSVPREDPHAAEWRIRRESYAHLQRYALPAVWAGPVRALDLGAGCGWLSHRLAAFGYRTVAVDCLDDDADGLGACRHYPDAFTTVQADFDALPFEPQQFDLVIFNASLHYSADPAATVAEAKRMLIAGGVIAVMDSPMFAREADGEAMLAAQERSMERENGLERPIRPGKGYLTFAALDRMARNLGLRGRFYPSRGPLAWVVRRQFTRWRLRRAPAAFGLWVAR